MLADDAAMATSNDNGHVKSHFTIDRAKAALCAVLTAFSLPDNMSKLDSAKTAAGNDMIKIMQTVFPLVTQIQMEVIQAFGFTADGEGAIQFAQAIRAYEKDDPEIAKLNAEIRAYFIPQMAPQLPTPLSPTSAS